MTHRRLFNLACLLSLLLCIASAVVWHRLIQTHLPESDRFQQRGEELRQAFGQATPGTPRYDDLGTQLNNWKIDWEMQLQETFNQPHPDRVKKTLAERRAYEARYVVLPQLVVIALAILPMAWLVRSVRRRLPRRAPAATLVSKGRRIVSASLAAICFLLTVLIPLEWVRTMYFVSDRFLVSNWFDEGTFNYWRQSRLLISRGEIGFASIVQSGSKATYHREIVAYVQRQDGMSIDDLPIHDTYIPAKIDFQFGSEQHEWGFTWGSFDFLPQGNRGHNFSYEFIAPIWAFEVLLLPFPLLWIFVRIRARRRFQTGQCVACGYNLTGNTSGLCPECGANVERKTDIPSLPSAPG
jgi:hypothetical protein